MSLNFDAFQKANQSGNELDSIRIKNFNIFSIINSMKKLLMLCAFILGSCAYDAKIDSKSTMASCIDKGLDESPLIECSSAYADERKHFAKRNIKDNILGFVEQHKKVLIHSG